MITTLRTLPELEFGGGPRSVNQQGPLPSQALAHIQNHALRLLRDRLHWHEMHVRLLCRLTDRLGVIAAFLPRLTNCGGIRRTLWPCAISSLAG